MKALAILILYLSAIGIALAGGVITLLLIWMVLGTETLTHMVGGGRLMTLCICGLGGMLFLEIVIRILWHFLYKNDK